MSEYILMRNNKQTGPFSKEQLIQNGLKPYDLIWIEKKSAMWRYPSEITELKEHAAMVEEQPYDRFYKKTEEKKEQEATTPSVSAIQVNKEYVKPKEQPAEVASINTVSTENEYAKPMQELHEQYMPKKTVSVIMPKQAVEAKKQEPVFTKKEEPVFIPTPKPVPAVAEEIVEVETKYSETLDEIKERYVKQLQQRKQNTAQKKFIMQMLKNAAVFIAIIGSGVLIGFIIKPKTASKSITANTPAQNVTPANTDYAVKENPMLTGGDQTVSSGITETNLATKNNIETTDNLPEQTMLSTTDSKSNIVEKKKIDQPEEDLSFSEPTMLTNANTERNKSTRNTSTENKTKESIDKPAAISSSDIASSVSVNANNYKLRDFGGFRNLELTVTNDSKVLLNNVLVELQYLNINDQALKIEHIRFQSIEPESKLTIKVPDNKRGAKLTYKIIKIEPSK